MLHGAETAGNYIASTADKYGGKVKDGLSSVTNSVSGVLNGAKNSVDNLFSGVETLVIVGLIGGAMLLYKGGNAAVNNAPAAFHYVANNAPAAMRTAAEVDRITRSAEAQAKANEELAKSLTAELIRSQEIQAWDGKLPVYMGGDSPIPFINVGGK
jgi:hypothetical protein